MLSQLYITLKQGLCCSALAIVLVSPSSAHAYLSDYYSSWGLAAIKAGSAWNKGITGAGVTVGVMDSGMDWNHPTLAWASYSPTSKLLPIGYNAYTGHFSHTAEFSIQYYERYLSDSIGHGTHVAGIIAGKYDNYASAGVAPNAQIYTIKIDVPGQNGNSSDRAQINAVMMANYLKDQYNKPIRIFNLSYGSNEKLAAYMGTGRVLVQSAGNNGYFGPEVGARLDTDVHGNPWWWQWNYTTNGWDWKQIRNFAVVVATDENGRIANSTPYVGGAGGTDLRTNSKSNICGFAWKYCVAAPGRNIYSSLPYGNAYVPLPWDGHGTLSGTSMAAPHVSGALALLAERWGYVPMEDLLQVVFYTANRNFAWYDPWIYGWGVLDVDRAILPYGRLWLPATSMAPIGTTLQNFINSGTPSGFFQRKGLAEEGNGAPLDVSVARFSRAFGISGLDNVNVIALDEFGRDFSVPASGILQAQQTPLDVLSAFDEFDSALQMTQTDEVTLAFSETPDSQQTLQNTLLGGTRMFGEMRGKQYSFAASTNMAPSVVISLAPQEMLFASSLVDNSAMVNNFTSLAKNASSMAIKLQGSNDSWFALNSFHGKQLGNALNLTQNRGPEGSSTLDNVYGLQAQFGIKPFNNTRLAFESGYISEEKSMLGSTSSGATALADSSSTYFISSQLNIKPSEKWTLFASAEMGMTSVDPAANSLIKEYSTIRSQAFRAGVMTNNALSEGDSLGFVISQPLYVTSGRASLNLPTTIDQNGQVGFNRVNVGLQSQARETDLQLFYQVPLSDSAKLSTAAMLRDQPNNVANAPSEAIGLMRLKISF